jgi:exodeoxyribonuclease VII large subunit
MGAPAEVAAAIAALAGADIDVIVLVRGGGARADLDAFDSELVARAVASAEVPVWTGVGHTGDRYLADEVAAAAHATPTACAHALVAAVAGFDRAVGERARRIQELARAAAGTAQDELVRRRRHLAVSAGARLDRRTDALVHQGLAVQRAAGRVLAGAAAGFTASATRLPRVTDARLVDANRRRRHQAENARNAVAGGLARSERDLAAVRRVLTAYDPARQLERGWTLTFGQDGALVRRAGALRAGERITSRFVDGDRTSVVEAPVPASS